MTRCLTATCTTRPRKRANQGYCAECAARRAALSTLPAAPPAPTLAPVTTPEDAAAAYTEAWLLTELDGASIDRRTFLARKEYLTPKVALLLSRDRSSRVRDTLARNRSLPPEVLPRLIEESRITSLTLAHLSPALLTQGHLDDDGRCYEFALPELLEGVDVSSLDWIGRDGLARNPATSVETLRALLSRGCATVLSHPSFPVSERPTARDYLLSRYPERENHTLSCLSQSPTLTSEERSYLTTYCHSDSLHLTSLRAVFAHASPGELEDLVLSYPSSGQALATAAQHPATPSHVLRSLAQRDRFADELLINPSTPTDVLDAFAHSPRSLQRYRVASHPNLSSEALDALAESGVPGVLRNPSASAEQLRLVVERNMPMGDDAARLLTLSKNADRLVSLVHASVLDEDCTPERACVAAHHAPSGEAAQIALGLWEGFDGSVQDLLDISTALAS